MNLEDLFRAWYCDINDVDDIEYVWGVASHVLKKNVEGSFTLLDREFTHESLEAVWNEIAAIIDRRIRVIQDCQQYDYHPVYHDLPFLKDWSKNKEVLKAYRRLNYFNHFRYS